MGKEIETTEIYEFMHNEYVNSDKKVIFALEGSSGAGKTWSIIDFVIDYCRMHAYENKLLTIGRESYKDCFDTVIHDFIKRLKMIGGYEEGNHFQSHPQKYFLLGNEINFTGWSTNGQPSKRQDLLWFNETFESNEEIFKQYNQRTNDVVIVDYNPKVTEHWVYDKILNRSDCRWRHCKMIDNPFLPEGQRMELLAYEPWFPGSYDVDIMRQLILYNGNPVSPGNYPPPHPDNIRNGTADTYMWMVYGLGLRMAQTGLIFQNVNYIDEWPVGVGSINGLDFGFTCFSGDTKITTIKGYKPIKDIKKGDLVLTRKGYKQVVENHDNGIKKVVHKIIDMDFGYKEIICTVDHKFKTKDSWKSLKELQEGDILCLNANTTERNTEDTQMVNTQTTSIHHVGRRINYIGKYGKMFMVLYQMISTYIILMEIRSIMILKTLCSYLIRNMLKYMIDSQEARLVNQIKDIQKKTGMKDELSQCVNYHQKQDIVSIVEQDLSQLMFIKNSALRNAITNGNMWLMKTMSNIFVRFVAGLSCAIDILNKKLVQINALINYHHIKGLRTISEFETNVYDLTIEDEHEYFANDILVHNCDPSALVRVGETSKDIFLELLLYSPMDSPELIDDYCIERGVNKRIMCFADSSDKYTKENSGTIEMVKGLKKLGWNIKKVKKTKSIMYWLGQMKKKRINIINNDLMHHFKKEQQNYKMKEINGIPINQPIDKYNHAWDAGRYGFMGLNGQGGYLF